MNLSNRVWSVKYYPASRAYDFEMCDPLYIEVHSHGYPECMVWDVMNCFEAVNAEVRKLEFGHQSAADAIARLAVLGIPTRIFPSFKHGADQSIFITDGILPDER